jgi:hypothetical protein
MFDFRVSKSHSPGIPDLRDSAVAAQSFIAAALKTTTLINWIHVRYNEVDCFFFAVSGWIASSALFFKENSRKRRQAANARAPHPCSFIA